jgi:hypothetical protein
MVASHGAAAPAARIHHVPRTPQQPRTVLGRRVRLRDDGAVDGGDALHDDGRQRCLERLQPKVRVVALGRGRPAAARQQHVGDVVGGAAAADRRPPRPPVAPGRRRPPPAVTTSSSLSSSSSDRNPASPSAPVPPPSSLSASDAAEPASSPPPASALAAAADAAADADAPVSSARSRSLARSRSRCFSARVRLAARLLPGTRTTTMDASSTAVTASSLPDPSRSLGDARMAAATVCALMSSRSRAMAAASSLISMRAEAPSNTYSVREMGLGD